MRSAAEIEKNGIPIDRVLFSKLKGQWDEIKSTISDSKIHRAAAETLAGLAPFHFPVAFPEVFIRRSNEE